MIIVYNENECQRHVNTHAVNVIGSGGNEMKKVMIYFIFTDTGTNLSRMINVFTRQSLNHVSIGFDKSLNEVYSFGRNNPKNPFSGGFVKEDIKGAFLKNARCAVYTFELTETERDSILRNIKKIETNQQIYRYNFIGLIGVLLQVEIRRKYAYFCSEFVAEVLRDTTSIMLSKPHCFITPTDIRSLVGMELIYEGKLGDYQCAGILKQDNHREGQEKSSTLLLITKRVKQFVMR